MSKQVKPQTNNETTKPPLLFIHGFRGNHLGLTEVETYFKKQGYDCYVPDIPPALNTKKEHVPKLSAYTADGYAKWVADYILEHHLDRPILIGHSMGSIICAPTAEKYPELINERIFFLSPICETPPPFICQVAPLVRFVPSKLSSYLTTKYLITPKDKHTLKRVLDITYRCAEKFTSLSDVGRAAKFSISYSISDFDFKKQAVFIAGESDKLNSQKQVKKMAKKYQSEPIFLANSGHLVNYERPLALAKAIEQNL